MTTQNRTMYRMRERSATTPGMRYTTSMKTITMAMPMRPAMMALSRLRSPREAPTAWSLVSFSSKGREPELMMPARYLA